MEAHEKAVRLRSLIKKHGDLADELMISEYTPDNDLRAITEMHRNGLLEVRRGGSYTGTGNFKLTHEGALLLAVADDVTAEMLNAADEWGLDTGPPLSRFEDYKRIYRAMRKAAA